MHKITDEQIKTILEELFKLNLPVQSYSFFQKLLTELPIINENNAKPEVPTK